MPRGAAKRALRVLVVVAVAGALGFVVQGLDTWRYSRDLRCEKQPPGRPRALCRSIERNLEYTCCGHGIVSPGFRSTLATVEKVWCEQVLQPADAPLLAALSGARDLRLSVAAESLLRLLTGHDRHGTPESEVSVLNPAHASYLLKDGCGGAP